MVTVGQDLEVVVLELDVDGRKLSLGHKQVQENPWNKYQTEYAEGTVIESSIHELVDKGAAILYHRLLVH